MLDDHNVHISKMAAKDMSHEELMEFYNNWPEYHVNILRYNEENPHLKF